MKRAKQRRSGCGWAAVLSLALLVGGCMDGSKTKEPPRENPQAEYPGLAGKKVAVLGSAGDQVMYEHPGMPGLIARALAAKLAEKVPGIQLMDVRQLADFQRSNPYWSTLLPGDLLRRLQVDRLVLVDVSHYSTHEPGNAQVWQGQLSADVAVYEAGNGRSNQPTYRVTTSTAYPDRPGGLGVVQSDDKTIAAALLGKFARRTAWYFYDQTKQESEGGE